MGLDVIENALPMSKSKENAVRSLALRHENIAPWNMKKREGSCLVRLAILSVFEDKLIGIVWVLAHQRLPFRLTTVLDGPICSHTDMKGVYEDSNLLVVCGTVGEAFDIGKKSLRCR